MCAKQCKQRRQSTAVLYMFSPKAPRFFACSVQRQSFAHIRQEGVAERRQPSNQRCRHGTSPRSVDIHRSPQQRPIAQTQMRFDGHGEGSVPLMSPMTDRATALHRCIRRRDWRGRGHDTVKRKRFDVKCAQTHASEHVERARVREEQELVRARAAGVRAERLLQVLPPRINRLVITKLQDGKARQRMWRGPDGSAGTPKGTWRVFESIGIVALSLLAPSRASVNSVSAASTSLRAICTRPSSKARGESMCNTLPVSW